MKVLRLFVFYSFFSKSFEHTLMIHFFWLSFFISNSFPSIYGFLPFFFFYTSFNFFIHFILLFCQTPPSWYYSLFAWAPMSVFLMSAYISFSKPFSTSIISIPIKVFVLLKCKWRLLLKIFARVKVLMNYSWLFPKMLSREVKLTSYCFTPQRYYLQVYSPKIPHG